MIDARVTFVMHLHRLYGTITSGTSRIDLHEHFLCRNEENASLELVVKLPRPSSGEGFSCNFSRYRPLCVIRKQIGCFAITLSAVFDDAAPNAFLKESREALWTEAKRTLPRSVFEYSHSSLRKALTTVKSAYGPVRLREFINEQ